MPTDPPNPPLLDQLMGDELTRRADANLLRSRVCIEPLSAVHIRVDGQMYVSFCSNDYLGLSHHPEVARAAAEAMQRFGAGAGASPLITGYTPAHAAAEAALARWKGTESAVLLPSGYQTSHAIVQTLGAVSRFHAAGVRFLIDKLAHASLIDAVRASGAPCRVFPHNHIEKLARLLRDAPPQQIQVVVTESIYSMDGDAAPLREIAELKRCSSFTWLLDEAHGSGVYGEQGCGLAGEMGVSGAADVHLVTLSKALGLSGGAACGSSTFCAAMNNFGRAAIFSTAVSPAIAGAVPAALDVLRREPERRARVRRLATQVRQALGDAGIQIPAGDSPIIPVILGSESAALAAARMLRERGLWVQAIRPPTVAPKTSRLRVTVSSEHSDAEIEQLIAALTEVVRAA